jgi:hypothetical protein
VQALRGRSFRDDVRSSAGAFPGAGLTPRAECERAYTDRPWPRGSARFQGRLAKPYGPDFVGALTARVAARGLAGPLAPEDAINPTKLAMLATNSRGLTGFAM